MKKKRTGDEFEFFLKNRSDEADSEKHNRTLLDFIPYPMAVLTLDGLVSYLNPAFTDVFGRTLEELNGKSVPYGSARP